jgi:hypothetical protein
VLERGDDIDPDDGRGAGQPVPRGHRRSGHPHA